MLKWLWEEKKNQIYRCLCLFLFYQASKRERKQLEKSKGFPEINIEKIVSFIASQHFSLFA